MASLGGHRVQVYLVGMASPACPAPCVGPSLEALLGQCGGEGTREEGRAWDLSAKHGVKNKEGLAPARSHQDQGSKTASWIQSHPDDAIVQSHRTISLGWESP